ncbi:MAG TPA: hypothetical protein VK752_01165 [Bryobacteraceae bacterium]|jgi:hypothetical protein|nr:hypothetical protein [Bryobacteraceae bacterium]
MDPSIQAEPGYYVWELPGKPIVVHLNLDVVDRLSAEIMRGFGLVPKRGAEVGGVLLGTIEQGAQTVVRVEDFEAVACDYKRGPSYLLTADDGAAFDDACMRWLPDSEHPAHAVGYFRSHTRENMSLGPEDIDLMENYFPSPSHISLLVKPFATKVSVASFFFREDGLFQSAPPLEFPFRRRELAGEEAPPRRSMLERAPRRREPRAAEQIVAAPAEEMTATPPEYPYTPPPKAKGRAGWVWIPLSFVFLLLGVVLGFQAALTMGSRAASSGAAEYSLGLTVTREGANLSVKWDRDAPAVKAAQRGLLEIEDGGFTKPVDLDPAQLSNGSILFTNSTGTVRFRLIVYPQAGLSVTQIKEWKEK